MGARFAREVGASVSADTARRQLRGQASLLRPAARIKSAQHQGSASAEGVGALRGYESSDGLRSGPNTSGPWFVRHTACTGLLPLRARSRASLAPTAFGQNQKLCGQASQTACGQNQKRAAPGIRFCRRRRSSSRLQSSDGLRSGPNISGSWFAQTHRVHRFTAAARQIAGKPRSYGLRPESKASRASFAPTAFGQNQKLCVQASQTAFGQNQKRATSQICFCRRRRSVSRHLFS